MPRSRSTIPPFRSHFTRSRKDDANLFPTFTCLPRSEGPMSSSQIPTSGHTPARTRAQNQPSRLTRSKTSLGITATDLTAPPNPRAASNSQTEKKRRPTAKAKAGIDGRTSLRRTRSGHDRSQIRTRAQRHQKEDSSDEHGRAQIEAPHSSPLTLLTSSPLSEIPPLTSPISEGGAKSSEKLSIQSTLQVAEVRKSKSTPRSSSSSSVMRQRGSVSRPAIRRGLGRALAKPYINKASGKGLENAPSPLHMDVRLASSILREPLSAWPLDLILSEYDFTGGEKGDGPSARSAHSDRATVGSGSEAEDVCDPVYEPVDGYENRNRTPRPLSLLGDEGDDGGCGHTHIPSQPNLPSGESPFAGTAWSADKGLSLLDRRYEDDNTEALPFKEDQENLPPICDFRADFSVASNAEKKSRSVITVTEETHKENEQPKGHIKPFEPLMDKATNVVPTRPSYMQNDQQDHQRRMGMDTSQSAEESTDPSKMTCNTGFQGYDFDHGTNTLSSRYNEETEGDQITWTPQLSSPMKYQRTATSSKYRLSIASLATPTSPHGPEDTLCPPERRTRRQFISISSTIPDRAPVLLPAIAPSAITSWVATSGQSLDGEVESKRHQNSLTKQHEICQEGELSVGMAEHRTAEEKKMSIGEEHQRESPTIEDTADRTAPLTAPLTATPLGSAHEPSADHSLPSKASTRALIRHQAQSLLFHDPSTLDNAHIGRISRHIHLSATPFWSASEDRGTARTAKKEGGSVTRKGWSNLDLLAGVASLALYASEDSARIEDASPPAHNSASDALKAISRASDHNPENEMYVEAQARRNDQEDRPVDDYRSGRETMAAHRPRVRFAEHDEVFIIPRSTPPPPLATVIAPPISGRFESILRYDHDHEHEQDPGDRENADADETHENGGSSEMEVDMALKPAVHKVVWDRMTRGTDPKMDVEE